MQNPELRLTSGSRQDRGGNARTTDKGSENRRIYSLISRYNQKKRELTPPKSKKVYWGLLQPHQRLMSAEMSGIGFENVLTFNGVPVLIDSHQAANTMYFLNEKFLKLYVHSSEDMRFEKITQIEGQAATLGRIFWAGNLVDTTSPAAEESLAA